MVTRRRTDVSQQTVLPSPTPLPTLAIVRVSPRPKEAMRYSPERQQAEIRQMASDWNLDIIEWVHDLYRSGRKDLERPSKMRAIEMARAGKIRAVAVGDWSRWSREAPLDALSLVNELLGHGVWVLSHSQRNLRPDSKIYAIELAMTAHVAHESSVANAQMASDGIARAIASGVWSGHVPFGWRKVGFTAAGARGSDAGIEPDRDGTFGRLEEIYRLRAKGYGWRRLSRATGKGASTLQAIVRHERNRAAVGAKLYDRANAVSNPGHSDRKRVRAYLFSGLVRCWVPKCSSTLIGQSKTKAGSGKSWSYTYMTCNTWKSGEEHKHRTVRQEVLLAELRDTFDGLSLPPEAVDRLATELSSPQSAPEVGLRQRRIADLDRQLERVRFQHQHTDMSDEDFLERVAEINGQRASLPAEPFEQSKAREAVEMVTNLLDLAIPQRFDDLEEVLRCNALLRAVISKIQMSANRVPRIELRPEYAAALKATKKAVAKSKRARKRTLKVVGASHPQRSGVKQAG